MTQTGGVPRVLLGNVELPAHAVVQVGRPPGLQSLPLSVIVSGEVEAVVTLGDRMQSQKVVGVYETIRRTVNGQGRIEVSLRPAGFIGVELFRAGRSVWDTILAVPAA